MQPSDGDSPGVTRMKRLVVMIGATAEAMGTELSPEAIKVFARDLWELDDATIEKALARTRREVKGKDGFAPKLLLEDVLTRAGVISEGEIETLEAVTAWDEAVRIAARFGWYKGEMGNPNNEVVLRRAMGKPVQDCPTCAGRGFFFTEKQGARYVDDCPCRTVEEVPAIDQRLADTVQRMGGWAAFKNIPAKSFPFVRRDFLAEYARWTKVESYRSAAGNTMLHSGPAPALLGDRSEARPETPHRLEGTLARILASDFK